jgi:hypothetical protein
MGFAEPVLGLAEGKTRGLNPSYKVPMALFFLFPVLFFPVFAPVIRRFGARAFSFAISGTFPVFGANRRPVDRLYFSCTSARQT